MDISNSESQRPLRSCWSIRKRRDSWEGRKFVKAVFGEMGEMFGRWSGEMEECRQVGNQ